MCVCNIMNVKYIYIPHLLYSPIDRYLGNVHVLAIVNNAAMNMEVHKSFQVSVSFPLDIYPEVELLDHIVVLFSIF